MIVLFIFQIGKIKTKVVSSLPPFRYFSSLKIDGFWVLPRAILNLIFTENILR